MLLQMVKKSSKYSLGLNKIAKGQEGVASVYVLQLPELINQTLYEYVNGKPTYSYNV